MSNRNDVPPGTVGVDLREEGIVVEYADGRETLYRGVPSVAEGSVRTGPGKECHLLVTDPTETEGVMLYINDLKTEDEILEDTGVGRVMLDPGESEEVFPGVTAKHAEGRRTEIEADPEVARGRVFVFVEDDWGEQSFEIVEEAETEEEAVEEEETAEEGETVEGEEAVDEDETED